MAEKLRQQDFKDFESAFNTIRRANREERIDAVGLLTPKLLREHIASGKDLILAYGRKGATVKYTLADLKSFAEALKKTKATHKKDIDGVPLLQLEQSSLAIDKQRMRQEVRNATLYRIKDNLLNFQVSASGKSGKTHHQVRVRLDEWFDQMTDPRTLLSAARNAAVGRISFDCTCGRHQYWFRYLATIGGFALSPVEKDFPKIRNPSLTGCCCKHVLRVIQVLKSATIHQMLAKEMGKQSEAAGYADKRAAKFLNRKELERARRARGTDKATAEAERAYMQFRKARESFKRKLKGKAMERKIEELQAKLKARGAKEKALKAKAESEKKQMAKDSIAQNIKTAMDAAEAFGATREAAIKLYVDKNKVTREEVESIIEEYGL